MCIKAGLAINDIFLISIYITDAHAMYTLQYSNLYKSKEKNVQRWIWTQSRHNSLEFL